MISFLREKQFVGCNGLEITDEIRATIAAQACLLLLGRPGLYDELQSILVYPGTFWVEDEVHDDDGLVTHRRRELSGEAWDSHRIILSWEDIAETARQPADGYNVVLHEFAHYLDAEAACGTLPHRGRGRPQAGRGHRRLAQDLVAEYDALCAAVDRGEATFLDPYAAEDEAEFFAVASEEFIECAAELREAHPRLYALLQGVLRHRSGGLGTCRRSSLAARSLVQNGAGAVGVDRGIERKGDAVNPSLEARARHPCRATPPCTRYPADTRRAGYRVPGSDHRASPSRHGDLTRGHGHGPGRHGGPRRCRSLAAMPQASSRCHRTVTRTAGEVPPPGAGEGVARQGCRARASRDGFTASLAGARPAALRLRSPHSSPLTTARPARSARDTTSSAPPAMNNSRIDRIDSRESPVTAAVMPTSVGPRIADALPIML